MSQIEIHDSILCDLCSNVARGVKAKGQRICFACADAELVKEIVKLAMPEMAAKLETAIAQGLKP